MNNNDVFGIGNSSKLNVIRYTQITEVHNEVDKLLDKYNYLKRQDRIETVIYTIFNNFLSKDDKDRYKYQDIELIVKSKAKQV